VRCPKCGTSLVAAVRPRVALQLLLAQSPFETWTLPDDARERGTGPAITVAELDVLRAELARNDVVEVLRATLDAA
jgi:hypothetical protein